MKPNQLLRVALITLMLWTPALQASLIGYDVEFTFDPTGFLFELTAADGMIYVDASIPINGSPNVDSWMFNVSWNSFFFGSGTDSFADTNCLSVSCMTVSGLTFDPVPTLDGEIFNLADARLKFIPLGSGFAFTSPDGLEATGTVSFTAKPVPEPTTLLLLGLSLMLLAPAKKYALVFSKI